MITPLLLRESGLLANTTLHQRVDSPYNYIPTRSVAIVFIVIYGVSAVLHIAEAIWYHLWWLLPTAGLAGALEVAGWSGRLWSSYSPELIHPFQLQITATILAPTPLLAANFIILGRIIGNVGPYYTRLKPKWYTILFCICDFISLAIQGVGGGLASAEVEEGGNARLGGNVMLGGIVFQLCTIVVFFFFGVEFFVRYALDRPVKRHNSTVGRATSRGVLDTRSKIMAAAMGFNTTCLFIRAVYRTVELNDGWEGRVIATQRYFNVLDGGMVTLAIYTLNIAHPGLLLFRDGFRKGVSSSALDEKISTASAEAEPVSNTPSQEAT